jgi:hypothetical protein
MVVGEICVNYGFDGLKKVILLPNLDLTTHRIGDHNVCFRKNPT